MTAVTAQTTLGELVLDEPARADLFESLGFDYCCHGRRTLAEACAQRGLDVETVVEVLQARRAPRLSEPDHGFDWRRASTADLCDHIVEAHHARLRRELPRLGETLATVNAVHGGRDPRLKDLARVFEGLAAELLDHLEREERLLFPACRALEEGTPPVDRELLLTELEHDHADVGETLLVLRDLAGGYRRDTARCGTHRGLIDGLRALDRDLHQHVHEETNVLFPRVRGLLPAA